MLLETSRISKYLDGERLRGTFCWILNKVLRAPFFSKEDSVSLATLFLQDVYLVPGWGGTEDGEKEPLLVKLPTALGWEPVLLGCPQESH